MLYEGTVLEYLGKEEAFYNKVFICRDTDLNNGLVEHYHYVQDEWLYISLSSGIESDFIELCDQVDLVRISIHPSYEGKLTVRQIKKGLILGMKQNPKNKVAYKKALNLISEKPLKLKAVNYYKEDKPLEIPQSLEIPQCPFSIPF